MGTECNRRGNTAKKPGFGRFSFEIGHRHAKFFWTTSFRKLVDGPVKIFGLRGAAAITDPDRPAGQKAAGNKKVWSRLWLNFKAILKKYKSHQRTIIANKFLKKNLQILAGVVFPIPIMALLISRQVRVKTAT